MPNPLLGIEAKIADALLRSGIEQSAALVTTKGAVGVDLGVLNFFVKKNGYKGIILCVDRPHTFYMKLMKENGLSPKGMQFINIGFKETGDNASSIGDNPGDLTFIKIEVVRTAQKMRLEDPGAKLFLLNDAVTTMLLYSDEKTLGQFMHDVSNKLRELNVYQVNAIEPTEKLGTLIRKFSDVVLELG